MCSSCTPSTQARSLSTQAYAPGPANPTVTSRALDTFVLTDKETGEQEIFRGSLHAALIKGSLTGAAVERVTEDVAA